MSLILDALRGGAPRTTPRPNSNAAQTDAVLQTLGYGRFSATSPLNRIKRLLGYLLVGILFAIVIWGSVIWITTQFLAHEPPMEVYNPAAAPARGVAPRPAPARPVPASQPPSLHAAASSGAPGPSRAAAAATPPPAATATPPALSPVEPPAAAATPAAKPTVP